MKDKILNLQAHSGYESSIMSQVTSSESTTEVLRSLIKEALTLPQDKINHTNYTLRISSEDKAALKAVAKARGQTIKALLISIAAKRLMNLKYKQGRFGLRKQ